MAHELYVEQLRDELRALTERHLRLRHGILDLIKSFCWDFNGKELKAGIERLLNDDEKGAT